MSKNAQSRAWKALSLMPLLLLPVLCLPRVQHEPTTDRPFVFMHLAKAAGSALRSQIVKGAQRLNISAEQTYVPCHDRACEVLNITQANYSVIAGHFGFRELEEAGIKEFDCLFNIREPVDRSISCLMHFYYESFRASSRWSAEVFKQKVITEAVKGAACYNDAVRMLISDPWLQEQALLEASKRDEGSSEMIMKAALASLQRCVVVDLSDVTNDQDWSTWAPEFLAAWFPWYGKSKIIPLSNVPRLSRRTYNFMRMPHRQIQVLEEVNDLDAVVYREALQVMKLQKEALQSVSQE